MIITFTPQRRDDSLSLHRAGDTLTIGGVAFDFSALTEGATLPQTAVSCPFLAGDVTRQGGRLLLALLLPQGGDAEAAVQYPDPVVDPPDGPVAVPGQPGTAEAGTTAGPIDWTAMRLPQDAMTAARASARQRMLDWIEGFLARFTDGVPLVEVQSWPLKATRARAHLTTPPDPSIVMEAWVNGDHPDDLARRILEKSEEFTMIAAATTGLRRATERAIDQARTPDDVEAALHEALGQAQSLMAQLGIKG